MQLKRKANHLASRSALRALSLRWISGRGSSFFSKCLFACLLFLLTLTSLRNANADEEASRFVRGLRERRLYQLAIDFGNEHLQSQQLTASAEAELAVELMQVHISLALQSSVPERLQHFADAHAIATRLLEVEPEHPQRFLIEVQDALVDLSAGKATRQELEIGVGGAVERERALATLQRAIRQLEDIDQRLEKEIPQRFRQEPGEDEFSAEQLLGLKQRAAFQRSIALQNQAMLFDEVDQANRGHTLTRVIEEYTKLGNTVPNEELLWWQIEMEHARCLRLAGDPESALDRLDGLPEEAPSLAIQQRMVLERALSRLSMRKPKEALRLLLDYAQLRPVSDPEFDEAELQCMLSLAVDSQLDEKERDQWQQQALAKSQSMGESYGAYWGRRASRLIVSLHQGGAMENASLLLQVGDESYLKQQYDDAVDAYGRAAELAKQTQDHETWMTAATKAGVLQLQLKRWLLGVAVLREAAIAHVNDARSPKLFQQAIIGASQAAREDAEQLSMYEAMLEESIATWPTTEEANQSRLWLAQLYLFRKQSAEAVELCFDVPSESKFAIEAIRLGGTAADNQLESSDLVDDEKQRTEVALGLSQKFQNYANMESEEPDSNFARKQAAVIAARLLLVIAKSEYDVAAKLLEWVRSDRSAEQRQSLWSKQADALYVIALASQPSRSAELRESIGQLASGNSEDLIEVVSVLVETAEQQSGSAQTELANAALQVVDIVQAQLAGNQNVQRASLDRSRAQLFRLSGKQAEAIKLYKQLLEADSRNGNLLEELAVVLSDSDDPKQIQEGLQRWRQLALGSRPQTDRWYRAKYHVAESMMRLGQKVEANRLLRFMKATPPGWAESSLSQQFEQLLEQTGK